MKHDSPHDYHWANLALTHAPMLAVRQLARRLTANIWLKPPFHCLASLRMLDGSWSHMEHRLYVRALQTAHICFLLCSDKPMGLFQHCPITLSNTQSLSISQHRHLCCCIRLQLVYGETVSLLSGGRHKKLFMDVISLLNLLYSEVRWI